jgi:hypothetical protein
MCEIKDFFKTNGKYVVICTYYDGDFKSAKTISIFDKDNSVAKITNFSMTHTKQCFNNNPISPVFMIEDDIEERFLQYGNKVTIG